LCTKIIIECIIAQIVVLILFLCFRRNLIMKNKTYFSLKKWECFSVDVK